MNVLIRLMDGNDAPEVLEIQQQNPSAAQWNEADYHALASRFGYLALVASDEDDRGRLLGFVVFRQTSDEAELLNFAVAPGHHRQGIGRALMARGIDQLAQGQVTNLFLEVRASNQAALRFYHSLGFQFHAVRKGYYQAPGEDASVLRLEVARRPNGS